MSKFAKKNHQKNRQKFHQTHFYKTVTSSDAASRWAEWALAHPEFGSSVNPITTRGADYAHHITASPPEFENPAASLLSGQMRLSLFPNTAIIFLKLKMGFFIKSEKNYIHSTELLRQIEWMGMTLSLIEKINHSQTHH